MFFERQRSQLSSYSLREVQAVEKGLEAGGAAGWSPAQLSQLGVLGFGFLQDGDVRVGVFPEV